MVTLIVMMLALQFGENWMMIAVVAVTSLMMRNIKVTILLWVAAAALFLARGMMEPYWPFVFFGLVILALLLGAGSSGQQQSELYSPDMYSGLMGGGM